MCCRLFTENECADTPMTLFLLSMYVMLSVHQNELADTLVCLSLAQYVCHMSVHLGLLISRDLACRSVCT